MFNFKFQCIIQILFVFYISEYTFIPSRKGHLLLLDGYTYFQGHSQSRNYYCSKKKAGCNAQVKFDKEGNFIKIEVNHLHDPPRVVVTKSGQYLKV